MEIDHDLKEKQRLALEKLYVDGTPKTFKHEYEFDGKYNDLELDRLYTALYRNKLVNRMYTTLDVNIKPTKTGYICEIVSVIDVELVNEFLMRDDSCWYDNCHHLPEIDSTFCAVHKDTVSTHKSKKNAIEANIKGQIDLIDEIGLSAPTIEWVNGFSLRLKS